MGVSEEFWTLCSFKNLKMQTLLIFSHVPLVKTIQIRLLTKVRAWTIRKLRKWSQFVPITFLNQHCPTIFFKLMSTLLKNSFHALCRAAPPGARLAYVYISKSADVMDWSKKNRIFDQQILNFIWKYISKTEFGCPFGGTACRPSENDQKMHIFWN